MTPSPTDLERERLKAQMQEAEDATAESRELTRRSILLTKRFAAFCLFVGAAGAVAIYAPATGWAMVAVVFLVAVGFCIHAAQVTR